MSNGYELRHKKVPMDYRLLTWFGTLVSFNAATQELCHLPVGATAENVSPVEVFPVGRGNGAVEQMTFSHSRTEPSGWAPTPPTPAGLVLDAQPVNGPGRRFHLSRSGRFLSSEIGGRLTIFQERPQGWETFLLVSSDELDSIHRLIMSRWIAKLSDGEPSSARLAAGFSLKVGNTSFVLDDNLSPFLGKGKTASASAFHRIVLYENRWQIRIYDLYRPLIYYAVFGNIQQFEMLGLSLQSLCRHGYPDGDVLIITDAEQDAVRRHVPDPLHERTHIFNFVATSFIEWCAARYAITRWSDAENYRPLLYLDTDVVFDLPAEAVLAKVAASDQLAAQEEAFSPLATSDAVGSTLFARDNVDIGNANGFNSGVIGMRDVMTHRHVLELTFEMMDRVKASSDVSSLRCFDQAVANYVAVKTASFDLDVLTPSIRFFVNDVFYNGQEPKGLVHFWGGQGSRNKLSLMKRYLAGDLT